MSACDLALQPSSIGGLELSIDQSGCVCGDKGVSICGRSVVSEEGSTGEVEAEEGRGEAEIVGKHG